MEKQSFVWVEKYRPQRIEDCILTEQIKTVCKGILKSKVIPNLIITGSPGTGKSTIAKALCNELDYDFLFINGSDERGIDTLRTKIKSYASSMSLSGKKKAVIVDEADYLTNEAQAAFRGVIEEFANKCTFVFTCNFKNKLIEALHSRCTLIEFKNAKEQKSKLVENAYKKISLVLKQENVKFAPQVLGEVIVKYFPDFRRTLNELQSYAKNNNEIDVGILAQSQDADINVLCNYLKDKNFSKTRDWVAQNTEGDVSKIYRKLYDVLKTKMKPESIPEAIVHLAEHQYKTAFSADPEICLVACLMWIMRDCEWL